MLGLGGELGKNALGVFELGTIQTGGTFVPHRGTARSTLAAAGRTSALSPSRAQSTLTVARARGTIGNGS